MIDLIKAIISALAPLLYSAITGKFPDFPLDFDSFLTFILWIVGLMFGGATIYKAKLKNHLAKLGHAKIGKDQYITYE